MKNLLSMAWLLSVSVGVITAGCTSGEDPHWTCDHAETVLFEDMEESEITEDLLGMISNYQSLEGTWTGQLSCGSGEPREVTIEIVTQPSAELRIITGPGEEVTNPGFWDCEARALSNEDYLTIYDTGDERFDGRQVKMSARIFGAEHGNGTVFYWGGGDLEIEGDDEVSSIYAGIEVQQDGELSGSWSYSWGTETTELEDGVAVTSANEVRCDLTGINILLAGE